MSIIEKISDLLVFSSSEVFCYFEFLSIQVKHRFLSEKEEEEVVSSEKICTFEKIFTKLHFQITKYNNFKIKNFC